MQRFLQTGQVHSLFGGVCVPVPVGYSIGSGRRTLWTYHRGAGLSRKERRWRPHLAERLPDTVTRQRLRAEARADAKLARSAEKKRLLRERRRQRVERRAS